MSASDIDNRYRWFTSIEGLREPLYAPRFECTMMPAPAPDDPCHGGGRCRVMAERAISQTFKMVALSPGQDDVDIQMTTCFDTSH